MTPTEKRYFAKWLRDLAKFETRYRRGFRVALNAEIVPLMNRWQRFNTPEDVIEAIPEFVTGDGVRREQQKLYREVVPFAEDEYKRLERATRKADIDVYKYEWSAELTAYLEAEAALYITSMMEESRKEVTAAVQRITEQAIREGLSIGQTMDLLERDIPKFWRKRNVWRSELIARTEVLTATNYAADMGARTIAEQEGLTLTKKWLVRLDGRERPWHGDMARVGFIANDATFDVGGAAMQRPGDPNGGARNRCNCRCTLIREVVDND